jgi:hypothetical protein
MWSFVNDTNSVRIPRAAADQHSNNFPAAEPFIFLRAIGNALCTIFPQIILYLPSTFYAGN